MDDMFRAASSMSDSCRFKIYDGQNNAWTARFGVPMFEYYHQNPAKATRFARAMEGSARRELPSKIKIKTQPDLVLE